MSNLSVNITLFFQLIEQSFSFIFCVWGINMDLKIDYVRDIYLDLQIYMDFQWGEQWWDLYRFWNLYGILFRMDYFWIHHVN